MSDSTRLRIGLQGARELEINVDDPSGTRDAIEKAIDDGSPLVWLTDAKRHSFGVVVDKIAFVQIEGDKDGEALGFGLGA